VQFTEDPIFKRGFFGDIFLLETMLLYDTFSGSIDVRDIAAESVKVVNERE